MAAEIQSTQDKYTRADKTNDPPQIKENEVRITTRGRVKKYVDYATRLFQGGQDSEENKDNNNNNENKASGDGNNNNTNNERGPTKQFDTIVLKATGKAINKAVTTAEVVKRTIGDLHQETTLETLEIVDVWEPKEEGLQKVETTRRVASISIKLSRKVDDVNTDAPGYQKPIAQETGFNLGYRNNNRRGGWGRNRGGYRGNNRRNQGDRRRNRGGGFNNQRNQNRNFNNRGGNFNRNYQGGNRGPYNNYGGNRNQGGNNFNQNMQGGGGYRNQGGNPRMGGPQGGGGYRQNNFGSPRRYPRNDGRRGRGRPRGGYNW